MSDATDMILPMLREMRAQNVRLHGETAHKLDLMEHPLEKLEDVRRSFKQASSADSLLSKLVAGDSERRIEALEQRSAAFEGRRA